MKEGVRWLLRKVVNSVRVVEMGRDGSGVREVSGGGAGGGGRWWWGCGAGRRWRRAFTAVGGGGFFRDISSCLLKDFKKCGRVIKRDNDFTYKIQNKLIHVVKNENVIKKHHFLQSKFTFRILFNSALKKIYSIP